MKTLLLVAALTFFAGTVYAEGQTDAMSMLSKAKSLRCIVLPGTYIDWRSRAITSKKATWGKDNRMVFDSINFKKGTARLIGNVGVSNVMVILGEAGAHFLEPTVTGNLSLYTVYAQLRGKRFIAAFSRHMMFLRNAIPSQYPATCQVLE